MNAEISNKSLGQKFLNENQLQWLVVIFSLMIFAGFTCSRALASIGMISILVASLLYYGPLQMSLAFYRRRELLVLSLYFWVVFFSGIYSDDKTSWLNWVRIKLPCLALPLGFAPFARLDDKKLRAVLGGFILIFFISAVIVLVRYVLNFQAVNDSFNHGSTLVMPLNNHIRYSIMLAFSFFCCIYLLSPNQPRPRPGSNAGEEEEPAPLVTDKRVRVLLVGAAIFTFIVLHVFTVRSGLITLYLGGIYWSLREIFRRRKIFMGTALIFIIVIAPLAAYQFVPSFHNKLHYMRYDLQHYEIGKFNNNSDAMRLVSMKIGMDIWRQHKLIGCGAGDLKNECDTIYKAAYPQITEANYRLPHNQFIWMLATTGIVGLAAFLLAFLYPLFVNGNYNNWIFAVLHLALFASFFTEHTFEEQIGFGFYLIFLMIFINRLQRT